MIFEIILLILAIPAGYLIALLARDELVDGRKWFMALLVVSVLSTAIFLFTRFKEISWTSGFVSILALVSFIKSRDKRWCKRR